MNEMEDLDSNVTVIDEDVRINKMNEIKLNENTKNVMEIGNDFHSLHGWQSFRFGKNGEKINYWMFILSV